MQINFDAIPLFASLSRLDRARLIPNCAVIAFDEGQAIVRQGEKGDSLFIIIGGAARVVRRQTDGSDVVVAHLRQGECFGEVALLTGEQRTADVLAEVTGTTVLKLSRDRFSQLMKQHNDLAQRMARLLAERVSRTTCHVGSSGIDPFVVCLTVLISGNPWFTSYQNSIYAGLMEATEGTLFDHHQSRRAAFACLVAAQVAIITSIPYWQWLGLIR